MNDGGASREKCEASGNPSSNDADDGGTTLVASSSASALLSSSSSLARAASSMLSLREGVMSMGISSDAVSGTDGGACVGKAGGGANSPPVSSAY